MAICSRLTGAVQQTDAGADGFQRRRFGAGHLRQFNDRAQQAVDFQRLARFHILQHRSLVAAPALTVRPAYSARLCNFCKYHHGMPFCSVTNTPASVNNPGQSSTTAAKAECAAFAQQIQITIDRVAAQAARRGDLHGVQIKRKQAHNSVKPGL